MTTIKYIGLGITVFALAGCVTTGSSQTSMGIPSFSQTNNNERATLKVEKCPDYDASGTSELAATIIQSVISSSLNWFGNVAKSKISDDINNTILTYNIESPSSLQDQCITVTRYINATSNNPEPDLYFTAKVEFSDKNSSFVTFVPTSFVYTGYTPKDKENRKSRDVSIALGLAKPEKNIDFSNQDKTETIGRVINFGTIDQPDSEYYQADLKNNDKGQGTQWMKVEQDTPLTLVVQVIESSKPNQIVKLLAQTYVTNEQAIKENILSLEALQSEAALKEARIKDEQTKITALNNYYTSLNNAETAGNSLLLACSNLSDEERKKPNIQISSLQRAYDLELRKSHLEALKAGIANPLPPLHKQDGLCD